MMRRLRIALPGCYPVDLTQSGLGHWRRNCTSHGPKSMPRLFAASLVRLASVEHPSSGWRLWLYFRGGYAWRGDLYVDRRPLMVCRECGRVG